MSVNLESLELIMIKVVLVFLLFLASAVVVADSQPEDQALFRASAVQAMIGELGLRESNVPS